MMKKILKLTLVAVMMLGATSLYAQKLGRINTAELIQAMPETTEARTNMEAFYADLRNTMETMQVELNNKVNEIQQNEATWTESMKQLKYKDAQDLQARIEQYQQSASYEAQQKQEELMAPIRQKAAEAIKAVAQAGGFTAVFDTPTLVYYDETTVEDILPAVKAHLGIQ